MAPTTRTIFYSWQSDSPASTNRNLIENALERAAKAIRKDDTIKIDPRIDSDARGEAGAADIVATIFKKIDRSDVFVGDVTIIGTAGGRTTPNPNVLLELGYAVKALGWDRTLFVMNTQHGNPEALPFDLRQRVVVRYSMAEGDEDKSTVRAALAKDLESRLRVILEDLPQAAPSPPSTRVIEAIRAGSPMVKSDIRSFMSWLLAELDTINPRFEGTDDEAEEELLAALEASIPAVVEFTKLAEVVADLTGPGNLALEVFAYFEQILARYEIPDGFSGRYKTCKFDFYKFIGHELVTSLVAFLVRSRRWDWVDELARHDFIVRHEGRERRVDYEEISDHVVLLQRTDRGGSRSGLHAALLKERHTNAVLGAQLPFELFAEADLLLYLRGELTFDETADIIGMWQPWSGPAMSRKPRYLVEAERADYATKLIVGLGLKDVEVLKRRLLNKKNTIAQRLHGWSRGGPLEDFDPATIATR